MTDDEKAEAVLEALLGIKHCPICGMPMDIQPKRLAPFKFWVCYDKYCSNPQTTGHYLSLDYD